MKALTTIFCFLLFNMATFAQQHYKWGFDNVAEKAGWTIFQKGNTGFGSWTMGQIFNPPTPPNGAWHDYPVGGAPTKVIDWIVSPSVSFTSGGKIDNIKIWVYAITGSADPDDQFAIYLLSGSNDPSSATATLLVDLTNKVTSNNVYTTINNITIPPTTGTCYLGLKYTAKTNWFTVAFDDLNVTSNGSSACPGVTSLTTTNINSSGGLLSWPPVTGAIGYEYAVTTSATAPTSGTPSTTASVTLTGLNSSTKYNTYVRVKCASSYSIWAINSFTTTANTNGVNNISDNSDVIIYPNPAHHAIMISNLPKGGGVIKIKDLVGNELLNQYVEEDKININIANFSSGLYFIEIKVGSLTKFLRFYKN